MGGSSISVKDGTGLDQTSGWWDSPRGFALDRRAVVFRICDSGVTGPTVETTVETVTTSSRGLRSPRQWQVSELRRKP